MERGTSRKSMPSIAALAMALLACGCAARFPMPRAGRVLDVAGVLAPHEEAAIEDTLAAIEKGTGVGMMVVTIEYLADYPGTPSSNVAYFARAMFGRYQDADLLGDDDVLVLVVRGDRLACIRPGRAYATRANAAIARVLEQIILPALREGAYARGIGDGARALGEQLAAAPS
jgi:uncharacterized protein